MRSTVNFNNVSAVVDPVNPFKCQVQSERDLMWAHASPSGFVVPYNFSISLTCGFAFGHILHIWHCV